MQPLFYAALAFALGIGTAGLLPAPARGWFWGGLAAALLSALAAAACRRKPWLKTSLLMVACAAAGLARAQWLQLHPPAPDSLARVVHALRLGVREPVRLTGYVRGVPVWTAHYLRFDLACRRLEARGRIWAVRGGIRLYGDLRPRVRFITKTAAAAHAGAVRRLQVPQWNPLRPLLQPGRAFTVEVEPRPLRRLRDPGAPDFSHRLRRQGLDFQASLRPHRLQLSRSRPGSWRMRFRALLWSAISDRLDRLLSPLRHPRLNAVLRAMMLGDQLRLSRHTRRVFQIDGIYHLLVVAGLHIAILAGLLYWLARRLRLPPPAAGFLSLFALYVYSWLIAARAPAERALLMLTIYLLARWWYRERQPLNAEGAAALLMLAWRPLELAEAGWQMSFAAALLLAGIAYPVAVQVFSPRIQALQQWGRPGQRGDLDPRWAQFRLDWQLRLRGLAQRSPWLGARLAPALLRFALRLGEIAWVSLVLQLGFAGFMMADFHRYNPWAVLANALVVPLASLLLPLGWLSIALSFAAEAMAQAVRLNVFQRWAHACTRNLGRLLTLAGHGLLALAQYLAWLPQAALRVPTPPPWALLLYAGLVGYWLLVVQHWHAQRQGLERLPIPQRLVEAKRRHFAPLVALLLLAICTQCLAWCPFSPRFPARRLEAWVLDVGQGDAILVAFPERRTLLVDAGPATAGGFNAGRDVVAPFLWSRGLRRLDAVLLTHAHRDHIGGMDAVLRRFHPQTVWVAASLPAEPPVQRLLRTVLAVHARLRRLAAGERFRIGAAYLDVLAPPAAYRPGARASNADSVVVRIRFGGGALLLAGDAGRPQEQAMLAAGWPLASTVLKAGHHGSLTSSSRAFLDAVHPSAAIISVGAGNLYGLPAPRLLDRLQRRGIRFWRTDQNGAIECRFSATRLQIFDFRPPWSRP